MKKDAKSEFGPAVGWATRKAVIRRKHELIKLKALGQATPADLVKLERYKALLRPRPSADDRKRIAFMDLELRRSWKRIGELLREAACSPNVNLSDAGE